MINVVLNKNQNEKRISSREIAIDAEKTHHHVMRDIRKMEDGYVKVNGTKFGLVDYIDSKGQKRPEYQLTRKETLFIATKYNDVIRAKLINRWEELEQKVSQQYQLPQTFAEALLLAGKIEEERVKALAMAEEAQKQLAEVNEVAQEQAQQLTLATDKINVATKTIEEYQPQVDYAKAVKDTGESCLVSHLANIITQSTPYAVGQNRLYEFLRETGFLGTSGERKNKPYQQFIERGYFELKYNQYTDPTTGKIKYGSVTKVTPKGQEKIIDIYVKAQAL